jgi:hypothetical protein
MVACHAYAPAHACGHVSNERLLRSWMVMLTIGGGHEQPRQRISYCQPRATEQPLSIRLLVVQTEPSLIGLSRRMAGAEHHPTG